MSFNLAFFNGEVRRDRKQEAMMNSMNERDNFLRRMTENSEARALDDKKNKCSKVIQKCWRKHNVKRKVRREYRQKFDEQVDESYEKSAEEISHLLNLLSIFYESKMDEERLIVGLNEAVRFSRNNPKECERILPNTRRLLLTRCCIKFMNHATDQTNFFMVIRFLESFILPFPDLLDACSKIGYFEAQLKLFEAVCEPKPKKIGKETPPPRSQQVLARLFAPFDKTRSICTPLQASRFLEAICLKTPDFLFTNYVLPYFSMIINPRSPHFLTFLESAKSLVFTGFHQQRAELRLRVIVVEQTPNFEEQPDDEVLQAYFDTLAKIMNTPVEVKFEKTRGSDVEMEVDQDEVEKYLNDMVDRRLDSGHFRRIAHAYASLEGRDFVNIVALQKQFLAIVDTLAASDNFVKLLHNFIMKSLSSSGNFDAESKDMGLFKSAIVLFCAVVKKRFSSVADSEFNPDDVIPDFVNVLQMLRDVCLKVISLVHPDFPHGINKPKMSLVVEIQAKAKAKWQSTCDAMVTTLQVIQEKNARLHFLPESFWSNHDRIVVVTDWDTEIRRVERNHRIRNEYTSFVEHLAQGYESDNSDDEDEKPILSPVAARNLYIMINIPFVVPFMQRIKVLSKLLIHERDVNGIRHIGELDHNQGYGHRITVRREHLYEDAYESLAPNPSKGNALDLRQPIRVRMVNWSGMNEAGVDGGGIFREFLNEVLKEGFDVTRGLFQYTHDMLLYPNPTSTLVYGGVYYRHYHFLGQMLGKLLYEKQLIELRFAEFFIALVFGSHRNDKDIDLQHMKSFDPIVFKHLRSLLDMNNEQLEDLQLDFSIVTSEFDAIKTINLKANGKQIRVTVDNVQEYVRLYVNYNLRLKIAPMANALRRGINDVINIEWLTMFSPNEIQVLIAGTEEVFSVSEMKKNCACTNARDDHDAQYIEVFWSVVEGLSADDKKALLKFITGCSRPPIEGFQQINPPLGILLINDESKLPASATCMNMLKLPKYSTRERLEEKLRYAINSGAGFELM